MSEAVQHSEPCANCGVARVGHYCHHCGQRHVAGQLSLKTLGHDLVEKVAQIESGWWHTMRDLIIRPRTMLLSYFAGRRKHFAHPFAFLLLSATVYFLITSLFDEAVWQEFHRFLSTDAARSMSDVQRNRYIDFYRSLRSSLPYLMLIATLPVAALVRLCLAQSRHTVAELWLVSLFAVSLALALISGLALVFKLFAVPTLGLSMSTNFVLLISQVYLLCRFIGGGWRTWLRILLAAGAAFIGMIWLQSEIAVRYAVWPVA